MASQTWREKWKYILGTEAPRTLSQKMRAWIVNKWGASVFTTDNDLKKAWLNAYIQDGSRPSEIPGYVSQLVTSLEFKKEEKTFYSFYKRKLQEVAQPLLNEQGQPVVDAAGKVKIKLKEEARKFLIPNGLIKRLMSDPQINLCITDPNLEEIKQWAYDAKSDPAPDYIQNARNARIAIPRYKALGIVSPADQIEAATKLDKAIKWNDVESHLREYIAEKAWAELNNEVVPTYKDPYSPAWHAYLEQCHNSKPLPPPTLGKVTAYGLRLLHPVYTVNALVGGFVEGLTRFISAGIDYCFTRKNSTKAVATKAIVSTLIGATIVDGILHFAAKLTSLSGWNDGFKSVTSFLKKSCSCFAPNKRKYEVELITKTKSPRQSASPEKKPVPPALNGAQQSPPVIDLTAQQAPKPLYRAKTGIAPPLSTPLKRSNSFSHSHSNSSSSSRKAAFAHKIPASSTRQINDDIKMAPPQVVKGLGMVEERKKAFHQRVRSRSFHFRPQTVDERNNARKNLYEQLAAQLETTLEQPSVPPTPTSQFQEIKPAATPKSQRPELRVSVTPKSQHRASLYATTPKSGNLKLHSASVTPKSEAGTAAMPGVLEEASRSAVSHSQSKRGSLKTNTVRCGESKKTPLSRGFS